jgi:hypothetical protein
MRAWFPHCLYTREVRLVFGAGRRSSLYSNDTQSMRLRRV